MPGVENIEADRASREFKDDVEWTLNQSVFDKLCQKFQILPDIDLFASRLNNKVPEYSAWQPDPGAKYVDAFTAFWGGDKQVYVFPPFGILPRVLQKFWQDSAEGLVIVPFWTTKPWFTIWAGMLIDTPIVMGVTNKLLFLPYRQDRIHPLKGKLKLIAGILSTDVSKQRGFQQKQLRSCYKQGDSPHTNSTNAIGRNGLSFVMNITFKEA